MATIRIKLNLSNPAVSTNTCLVVGDQGRVHNVSRTIPQETPPKSSMWRGIGKSIPSKAGSLVINQFYQSFDEEEFKRWNWSLHAQLAALVDKGLVLVELDTVAQTSTYIRGAHIAV